MYARKVVEIIGDIDAATLAVSADLRYRIFINGARIGFGPPFDVGAHITHDTYDVRSVLCRGRNVIAAEVHTAIRPQGGFICQLNLVQSGERVTVATDSSWKVQMSKSWNSSSKPFASSETGWYSEIYDSKAAPHGWKLPDFDDSGWEEPVIPVPGKCGGAETPRACDRQLEPSELPALKSTRRFPASVLEVGEVTETEGRRGARFRFPPETDIGHVMAQEIVRPSDTTEILRADVLLAQSGGTCVVDNHELSTVDAYHAYWQTHQTYPVVRHATVTLDFGEIVNGHVMLDVTAPPGAVIDVAWAEVLFEGRVHPGMHSGHSHASRYILRGGRETIESFSWYHFRYLRLTFRDLSAPLEIHGLAVGALEYPFEKAGEFACSDERLNRIWDASLRTVEKSTVDNFYLDMYREVRIYADYPQSGLMAVLAAFGNPAVNHRFLKLLARHRDSNGFFLGLLEDCKSAYAFEQSLFVADLVAWTLFHWDDPDQVRTLYPAVMDFIRRTERFLDSDGMLAGARLGGMGSFIDWGGGHAKPDAVCLPQVFLFCRTMGNASAVARRHGDMDSARHLDQLIRPIRAYVFQHFWDEQRGAYVTNVVRKQPLLDERLSEHANYAALLLGLGGDGRRERLLASLRSRTDGVLRVEPMFTLVPAQALFAAGESTAALDFLRERIGRAFVNGLDTLPEEWSPFASFREQNRLIARIRGVAYASAAAVAIVLPTEVLGVKPITPGYSEFRVNPQCGDLTWARGIVPSPKGCIQVAWERTAARFALKVSVPPDCAAHIHLPEAKTYSLDGEAIAGRVSVLKQAGDYSFCAFW